MREAMFWEPARDGCVRCNLCHHRCYIKTGGRGICGVRENRGGRLFSLVYGRPVSTAVDPIEKKPLYHFLPGTRSLSLATVGCNFRCEHCQNSGIAHASPDTAVLSGEALGPAAVVDCARKTDSRSISYTYTEPTVFFEYAHDIARLAHADGIANVFVTNGYITPEALGAIAPFLDAANIDLKFFDDALYRDVCGARLQPVLDMIAAYHGHGIWIEITTLIIPTLNDDEDQLHALAAFIAGVDPRIPWHVTAFHPMNRMLDKPRTPASALRAARRIGLEAGLRHVYTGNLFDTEGSTTRCQACGTVLVEREGFAVTRNLITAGSCPDCGAPVAGVWE